MKCQEKVTHEAILALTLYRLAHRTTREEEKKNEVGREKKRGEREKEEKNGRVQYKTRVSAGAGTSVLFNVSLDLIKRVHNVNCNKKPVKGSE